MIQSRMESKDERRKRRLAQLASEKGGIKEIADAAGLAWAALDQILKGTLLPEKADGSRSPRSLGDPAAEAIEDAFNLGRGWFDWPFELIDHREYWSLTPAQQAAAQDRMAHAIAELQKKHAQNPLEKYGIPLGKKPTIDKKHAA